MCLAFKNLSFFLHGCATAPSSYGYCDYMCRTMAHGFNATAPWPPQLVQLPVAMRTLQFNRCADFLAPTPLQPLASCTPFLHFI